MSGTLALGSEPLFDSDYIAHLDLKGGQRTVKIVSFAKKELRAGRGKSDGKKKLTAKLEGKVKGWVINKTNAQRIAEVYGNQALDWIGKPIVIQPDKDRFGSDMVDCIRVNVEATRKAANGSARVAAPPQPDREPGADDFGEPDEQQLADGAAAAERE